MGEKKKRDPKRKKIIDGEDAKEELLNILLSDDMSEEDKELAEKYAGDIVDEVAKIHQEYPLMAHLLLKIMQSLDTHDQKLNILKDLSLTMDERTDMLKDILVASGMIVEVDKPPVDKSMLN